MAQEIRVLTWCDVCQAKDGAMVEAVSLTITLDTGKPRSIDLCERDEKTLLAPLREALADHGHNGPAPVQRVKTQRGASANIDERTGGVRLGRKPSGPRDIECLWCPTMYSSNSGLQRHLGTVHGFPTDRNGHVRITAAYGNRCPYCGDVMRSPMALGKHTQAKHPGQPGEVVRAFIAARAMGDPAGVVAEVTATAPDGHYRKPRKRT